MTDTFQTSTDVRLLYSESMIDVTQATTAAQSFMTSILKDAIDIRLEEVEMADDQNLWNITLSAIVPPTPTAGQEISALAALFKADRRVYKIFAVQGETGAVKSMKIRKVE